MEEKKESGAELTTPQVVNKRSCDNMNANVEKKSETYNDSSIKLLEGIQVLTGRVALDAEQLDKVVTDVVEETKRVSLFVAKTMNQTLAEAKAMPAPVPLVEGLWNTNEIACLFAPSGIGKSIYAMQLAADIAEREKVLYFDFELSDYQTFLRYSDGDVVATFPENLIRLSINQDTYEPSMMETDNLIAEIEQEALDFGAKVIIIDNLTFLSSEVEKSATAIELMKRLMRLKHLRGWSVLMICHTPKISEDKILAPNNLMGSKQLYNFFDSVFSVGKIYGQLYLIQHKFRTDIERYGRDNIILLHKDKINGFLQLVTDGYITADELEDKELMANMALLRKLQDAFGNRHVREKEINPYFGSSTQLSRAFKSDFWGDKLKKDDSGLYFINSANT